MSDIDMKKIFNVIIGRKFTAYDFISVFLPLLQESGVSEFTLDELSKKLFCYYKEKNFREIFSEINQFGYEAKVNVEKAINQEKMESEYLWTDVKEPSKIYLNYPSNMKLHRFRRDLSKDGLNKIRQMALDFSIRYQYEITSSIQMDIYGGNPEYEYYYLGAGQNGNNYIRWDLITDGEIKNIQKQMNQGNFFFENPKDSENKLLLNNNTIKALYLKNAKYAILQGYMNDKIKRIKVYTELLDKYSLKQIQTIANTEYNGLEKTIDEGKPYIRKIKI